MQSVITKGPLFDMADRCCGTNWITKKALNAVFVDDEPAAGGSFLLLESGDYLLMEDDISKFELE